MKKKIFAAVFSAVLLCSCGKENIEELSETGSETTVTTAAAETTSEAVSEETEIAAEVSEAEEKVPITRDFFNDDVVWEEVMLPVKIVKYYDDGTEWFNRSYKYDAAGNLIDEGGFLTYEYDYNPDGTYNSVFEYRNGKLNDKAFYDKNGYCLGYYPTENKYEFDDSGRLIRKEDGYGYYEYSYDENGRIIYETHSKAFGDIWYYKYEYGSNFENVYKIDLSKNEEILWHIMEKDANGNTIKETYNSGDVSDYAEGKRFAEYEYDSMNRLIYENHTVSDDFDDGTDRINVYLRTYEYEGDKLKKEVFSYDRYNESTEYFYDENGRIVKEIYIFEGGANELTMQYPAEDTTEYFYNEDGTIISQTHNMNGVLIEEAEYAMIPKIKTDIEYLSYYDIKP